MDDAGKIVREARAASEPEALLQVLTNTLYRLKIGLEAGPLSPWLCSSVAEAGLPVICVETRHMRAILKAQINSNRHEAPTSPSRFACDTAWHELIVGGERWQMSCLMPGRKATRIVVSR